MNEDYLAITNITNYVISFLKFCIIGGLMYFLTTKTIILGLSLNINIWKITLFNTIFYSFVKWVLYKLWKM